MRLSNHWVESSSPQVLQLLPVTWRQGCATGVCQHHYPQMGYGLPTGFPGVEGCKRFNLIHRVVKSVSILALSRYPASQSDIELVLPHGLALWAQSQPYSRRHKLVPPSASVTAQLVVAEPVPGLAIKGLSPMVFALFQGPPIVPRRFFLSSSLPRSCHCSGIISCISYGWRMWFSVRCFRPLVSCHRSSGTSSGTGRRWAP